jgi:hypothetical protein
VPLSRPNNFAPERLGTRLRHVTGNALDHALLAATQLNHVAIRVAYEHGDLPALAKTDRPLRDRDIVRIQRGDGCRDDTTRSAICV